MPLQHWLQLSLTSGLGPILIGRLIESLGSAEAAAAATAKQLEAVDGIATAKASAIARSLRESRAQADDEVAKAHASGATIVCRDDETYPPLLRDIPDPPSVLYLRGTIEPRDLHSIAIVGSRKCSLYGREQAERFGALLAGAGICVTSGGARGIDSAAHRGALSHGSGRTLAVLGSGVDIAYPPENAALFEQIAKRGAVISEFPMGTTPRPENFPRRNRIVSGMSRGVLVIEADTRSGALITARQACDDHGRPVFALPGRADNVLSVGPHQLIRDGAILTTQLEHILEELGPLPDHVGMTTAASEGLFTNDAQPPAKAQTSGLSDSQKRVYAHLEGDPVDADQIIERAGIEAHVVMQALTFLSLKGLVRRVDGRYARRS